MPWLVALLLIVSGTSFADDDILTVAVASNFLRTAQLIADRYTDDRGTEIRIVSGSTGKLYAQIVNGAPYDVFLAADEERPARLEAEDFVLGNQRVTYARGRLLVFTADERFRDGSCQTAFLKGDFNKLSIANPATAPYGRAASEYLTNAGLWQEFESRLVRGENVSQATQFVISGNATFGIAQSSGTRATCSWYPDSSDYAPINQQAVVLKGARFPESAIAFVEFLGQPASVTIIAGHGYLGADE